MANKMTKIPAWPFCVIMNLGGYWPYNFQFMTFFYWDSPDKNLNQKAKTGHTLESITKELIRIYHLVANITCIPANALILCMADPEDGNNFC